MSGQWGAESGVASGVAGGPPPSFIAVFPAGDLSARPHPVPARRPKGSYRLRDLLDAMPEPAWIADARGRPVHVNAAWIRHGHGHGHGSGHAAAGGQGIDWRDALHPRDRPAAEALWAEALRTGLPYQATCRAAAGEGGWRVFTTDAIALRDAAGHIAYWCAIRWESPSPEPLSWDEDVQDGLRAGTPRSAAPPGPARACPSPAGPSAADPYLDVDVALRGGIDQLLRSLAHVRDMPDHLGRLYSRSLCLAILARLGNGRVAGDRGAGDGVAGEGAPPRRRQAPLPKWRVRRVTDHIAAHIGEPIRLADMARAAGLTRMYFAAQFRAATGMCPHDYLLDCRIRHAQALLADPAARLVDVALSVGFQTQSHFTTAFRRRTGETPHRWRRRAAAGEGGEAAHPPARAFPADTIDRRLA